MQALPPDSAVGRAINGQAADWSTQHELLAVTADRLGLLAWMYATAHSKRGAGRRPDPLPRPKPPSTMTRERRQPRRRHMTIEEMRAFFGGAIEHTKDPEAKGGDDGG